MKNTLFHLCVWATSLFILGILFLCGTTFIAAIQLKNGSFATARSLSTANRIGSGFFDTLTLQKIPLIHLLHDLNVLILEIVLLSDVFHEQMAYTAVGGDHLMHLSSFSAPLTSVHDTVKSINSTRKYSLFNYFISEKNSQRIDEIIRVSDSLQRLISELTSGKQTWLIVLQNADELRATGGFMGSYALVTITEGVVSHPVIEDIYDADGQLDSYVPAPPGLDLYLSGGKGMRLPNANWHPDYPSAAQDIISLMAYAGRSDIAGVISISHPAVVELLTLIEPIYLPSEQKSMSATEVVDFLQTHRLNFFPGSTQKKDQLSAVFTQSKLQFSNSNSQTFFDAVKVVSSQVEQKNIQAYSVQPDTQDILSEYKVTGALVDIPAADELYLVESNVGINKANREVARNLEIRATNNEVQVEIQWKNNNPPPQTSEAHLQYVNYQRVIVPTTWELISITVDDSEIPAESSRTIVTASKDNFTEFGYSIIIPELSEKKNVLTFSVSTENRPPLQALYLYKQAGVAPYLVKHSGIDPQSPFLLERDTLLHFSQ